MAEDKFKLPVSSYEEVTKIIKAYGNSPEAVVPEQLSHLTGQSPTRISGNNAFLAGIDIVDNKRKKTITSKGRNLARALEHEIPDEIILHWRKIVLDNEFFQKLLSAIRIRKGMDVSTMEAHVAYSAGLPKTSVVMTGARTVIDILRASGLVAEENGKLVIKSEEGQPIEKNSTYVENLIIGNPIKDIEQSARSIALNTEPSPTFNTNKQQGNVNVVVQIQIKCSAEEVDILTPKLKELLQVISNPESVDIISEDNSTTENWATSEDESEMSQKSESDESEA